MGGIGVRLVKGNGFETRVCVCTRAFQARVCLDGTWSPLPGLGGVNLAQGREGIKVCKSFIPY